MVRHNLISFRPNNQEKQALNKYMEAHFIKKENIAIRALAFQEQRIVKSSMLDKPQTQEIERRYFEKLVLIPPNLPNVKAEINKFLRGGKSALVELLFAIDEDSLNRAFTVATPKGILTLIPCARDPFNNNP